MAFSGALGSACPSPYDRIGEVLQSQTEHRSMAALRLESAPSGGLSVALGGLSRAIRALFSDLVCELPAVQTSGTLILL